MSWGLVRGPARGCFHEEPRSLVEIKQVPALGTDSLPQSALPDSQRPGKYFHTIFYDTRKSPFHFVMAKWYSGGLAISLKLNGRAKVRRDYVDGQTADVADIPVQNLGLGTILSCEFSYRTVEVNRKIICSVMQVGVEHFRIASLPNSDGCSI